MAKGLKTFSSEEGSNISAGQCVAYNWHPTGSTESARTVVAGENEFVDVDCILGIKAGFFASDCEVAARSLIGDHLSTDGTYDVSKHITIAPADIVWGRFDKVYTEDAVILYLKMK
tara:strand:+ start:1031 stop:1378 length:348 start_codon:yes stop_codon:yes gene_type:complete